MNGGGGWFETLQLVANSVGVDLIVIKMKQEYRTNDEPFCFLLQVSLYMLRSCDTNYIQGEESGWEKRAFFWSELSWFQRFKRCLSHSNEKYLLNVTVGKPSFLSSPVFWSSKKRAEVSFKENERSLAHCTYSTSNVFAITAFRKICSVLAEKAVNRRLGS